MTASLKDRYCVSVVMADYYSAWIEADSPTEAIAIGRQKWDADSGDFAFDGTTDKVDVLDWDEFT